MTEPRWTKPIRITESIKDEKETLNFSSVVSHRARIQPDATALTFRDRKITYRELDSKVSSIAKGLLNLGVRRGDAVSLLLYNYPEFLEVAFASNRIGAVFLPINYRLSGDEIGYILNDSRSTTLVTEEEFHGKIDSIRGAIKGVRDFITVGRPPSSSWTALDSLVERNAGQKVPDAEVALDDLHRLMYTSGTTAHPKGVMITYGNLYWKNIAHILELSLNKNDLYLVAGPLYHAGALDLCGTCVLHAGGSLLILRKFEVKEALEAIEKHKATVTWFAPSMVNMLLNFQDISSYDLSSMRVILNGGEKMPEVLIRRIQAAFPNAWFADSYGLTETISGDTFLDRENTIRKLGSVGRPVIHLQLRLVDEENRDVGQGELGEIVVKGPKVFKGYWNNPEATKAAFTDGWFHTGDIGRIDEDGYLYVVDRVKDMIKSGGENVASLEVERVIYEHPAVLEAAVVGVKDQRWGEVPVAFVVVKRGQSATQDEISQLCATKLAKFKAPKQVYFIESLPRNPSGKILKRLLREDAERRRSVSR